jgi:hypothetical protein
MINRFYEAGPLSPPDQRPWHMTLDERAGSADAASGPFDDPPVSPAWCRLVLGLACLGSALVSTTALVFLISWISPS